MRLDDSMDTYVRNLCHVYDVTISIYEISKRFGMSEMSDLVFIS